MPDSRDPPTPPTPRPDGAATPSPPPLRPWQASSSSNEPPRYHWATRTVVKGVRTTFKPLRQVDSDACEAAHRASAASVVCQGGRMLADLAAGLLV